jgi:GR25 family glycosyltransferase involved in LPS biosynthesis
MIKTNKKNLKIMMIIIILIILSLLLLNCNYCFIDTFTNDNDNNDFNNNSELAINPSINNNTNIFQTPNITINTIGNNYIMKIFVLHYSKLVDRKKSIIEQFKKQNITDYEFIEKYDVNEITDDESSLFETNFKKSSMSLHLKHNYVYNLIAKTYLNALIFEDDIILSDNFKEILNKYMSQLPKDYDMLFIGNGSNLHIHTDNLIPNKNIYEKCLEPTSWGGDGATRCTDSYIISNKCAKILCKYINNLNYKINVQIDWWLNRAARDNNLKVYWAEPTIVSQGSELGLFKSSL